MDALLTACLRYADRVDRCETAQEVILALDSAVRPTMRAYGIWQVPVRTLRGNRDPHPAHIHPDQQSFVEAFWPKFAANGPSALARYAWRRHRDFSLRDVLRTKPTESDLWIFQLLQQHHIGDLRYLALHANWYAVYWSPKKSVRLLKVQWRALRYAAEAATERIEELEGSHHSDPSLTEREREVLRLLRAGDKTETAVARQLKISTASVKRYVARARLKLGTMGLRDTIAEAVRRYVVLGLVYAGAGIAIYECCDLHWCICPELHWWD